LSDSIEEIKFQLLTTESAEKISEKQTVVY